MRFELDDALIDQFLFYMENQDGDFVFDIQEMCVIDVYNCELEEEPDFSDEERFIALPGWSSHDGYRLMENFTAGLKNPLARQELSSALNRNKGVFRAFRDILDQYPEIEKLWFDYKEKEMKREIVIWYNSLRAQWEMEPIGIEPEDSSSLILEDFIFCEEGEYCLKAQTAEGETAGRIAASASGGLLSVNVLEVKPEYRGMGVAKTLLAKLLLKADQHNLEAAIDVPAASDFFTRSLLLENFKPASQRFIRKKQQPPKYPG